MADAAAELELGRASYVNGAWRDAYESLSRADETTYEVDAEQAFARQPLGIRETVAIGT